MKTIKYIIAAALISTTFITGCNKEDNTYGTAASGEFVGSGSSAATNINYNLQTIPPQPGALLQWNTAYITSSEILFQGVQVCGNMLKKVEYDAKAAKTINLFNPSSLDLGNVSVPLGLYSSFMFQVQLSPLSGTNSVILYGTYTNTGISISGMPGIDIARPTEIPVQVTISVPVTLNSITESNILLNGPGYVTTLSLNLGQLTNGIDARMFSNATLTNGIMFINSTSNPNLYGVMLNNLQDNMMNVQFWAQSSSTVNPPVE